MRTRGRGEPGSLEPGQPSGQIPGPGEIGLLPRQAQLSGQDVLVVQGAGALHQGLAGEEAAGQVGSQGHGLSGLLGVQLAGAVYDEGAGGPPKTVRVGPQGLEQAEGLQGHAAFPGGQGDEYPPALQGHGLQLR